MGWMKRIYVMCQEGTFETEFVKPYHQALADEKPTMLFEGREITMSQAEGIEALAEDVAKIFKK
jgi:hypothetical protein